jgi:hypothetical protein
VCHTPCASHQKPVDRKTTVWINKLHNHSLSICAVEELEDGEEALVAQRRSGAVRVAKRKALQQYGTVSSGDEGNAAGGDNGDGGSDSEGCGGKEEAAEEEDDDDEEEDAPRTPSCKRKPGAGGGKSPRSASKASGKVQGGRSRPPPNSGTKLSLKVCTKNIWGGEEGGMILCPCVEKGACAPATSLRQPQHPACEVPSGEIPTCSNRG